MTHILRLVSVVIFIVIALTSSFSQTFEEVAKVVNFDRNNDDNFGEAVAISTGYAIVGAKYEDDEEDGEGNKYLSAGSAYILEKNSNGTWTDAQKIVASDREANDQFGNAVALTDEYAVVGAYLQQLDENGTNSLAYAGAAYVYENNGDGTWSEMQKLVPSDRAEGSYFGYSVSISGSNIIVGAYGNSEDENGINTVSYAGAAYIFSYNSATGNWEEVNKIVASDRASRDYFGYAVAISGEFAIVSAASDDEDENGENTLSAAGSVYVFKYNSTENIWIQSQKIVASDRGGNDCFGRSVAMDGTNVIIGSYRDSEDVSGDNTLTYSGSAYIFRYDDGSDTWSEIQKIVASDRGTGDNFGESVGISGDFAIVGAIKEDENALSETTLTDAGSAYCYQYSSDSDSWEQLDKVVPASRYAGDYFGGSVAISDSNIIVGAYANDYDELEENKVTNAGAAYFFEYNDGTTAILKENSKENYAVYPNPAKDILNIKQNTVTTSPAFAYFYDITGQLVKSQQLVFGVNEIDVVGLCRGFYIIKIDNCCVYKINLK